MNPWNVDTLEEFLYFCCPECDLRDQSKVTFLQHALEKHPEAKDYVIQFNEFIVKEEEVEQDQEPWEMMECELKYEHIDNTFKHETKTKNVKHPILSSMESKQLYEAGKKDKYCAVCVKTFYSAEKLRQHIEAIHEGLKHKCPHCHEEFSYKKFELSLHQKSFAIFTTSLKILLKYLRQQTYSKNASIKIENLIAHMRRT